MVLIVIETLRYEVFAMTRFKLQRYCLQAKATQRSRQKRHILLRLQQQFFFSQFSR